MNMELPAAYGITGYSAQHCEHNCTCVAQTRSLTGIAGCLMSSHPLPFPANHVSASGSTGAVHLKSPPLASIFVLQFVLVSTRRSSSFSSSPKTYCGARTISSLRPTRARIIIATPIYSRTLPCRLYGGVGHTFHQIIMKKQH